MDNFTIVNKTILLVAKRNSGKSYLLKYLVMCERKKFSKIFVICPTERVNKFYSNIVSDECIFDDYHEDWAESLIKKMTEINSNKPNNQRKNILLIIDDCIAFMNMHQSPSLKKLFSMGRHLNISLMITTQYLKSISPLIRNNTDYLYVGQMNRQSIEILTTEFLLGNIEKGEFIKMYNKATKDYSFLVINCSSVKDNN